MISPSRTSAMHQPGLGQLFLWKWCPHWICRLLLFETATERFLNVLHGERTHRGARDTEWIETVVLALFSLLSCFYEILWKGLWQALPVQLGGENSNHRRHPINVDYVCNGLKDVKVEKGFSRNGTVQTSLNKRCPVFLQHPLRPSHVIFTDPSHSGVNRLWWEKNRRNSASLSK